MNEYLLDTSTCSFLMANNLQVKNHLATVKATDYVFTCTIDCAWRNSVWD